VKQQSQIAGMNTGSNRSIPPRTLDHDFPKSLRFAEDETTVTDTSTSANSHESQRLPPSHRAVVLLKIIVIFILILSALMLSFLTYYFITQDESDDFNNQFADFGTKVMEEFLDITHLKVYTCYSLSIAYTTEFEGSDAFPAVTLNHFPVKAFGATDLARASCIGFAPYVTDQTRQGWETYATSVHPAMDLNSSALAAISSRSNMPISVQLDESETTMKIEDGIYKIENDTATPDTGPGPFFPLWQVSPVTEYSKAIMYNQLSDSSRGKALQIMMATSQPIYSEVFYQDVYDSGKDDGAFETRGVLYFPVFDTFVSGNVAGAVSAEFNWEDSFRYILPAHAKGIVCVLENTCGQTFTYVIEGEDVMFMGTGDLHDEKYDDMEVSTSYDDFLQTYNAAALFNDYSSQEYSTTAAESDTTDSERTLDSSDGCLYLVRIYPSAEFESLYHTTDALFYAGLVALVFVFTSIIFISYDCLVQRRQNQVMSTAARANAIVESLFPAMVRERVFQTNEHGGRAGGRKSPTPDWGSPSGGGAVKGDTPKKRLRSFLQVNRRSSRKIKEKVDPMLDPIADHFPETTIMFADIAGFTAWSSEREPSEVFQLLESVYFAFDSVARQMGVFKLETIGDCYVAATGLPEPNKDHAIIMTRFAFEALHQMQETTRKLEISLGPGTSDLSIRIGLHSGPVTGGVLRGEKSRFQLFGDTMNTAARMESNGQRDMVHISQATADLLEKAGKGHWVTPREDVIVAKGKGEMKTYWIKPRNMEGESDADQMAMIDEGSVPSESSDGRLAKNSAGHSFRVMFRRPRGQRASSRWGSMSLLEDTVGVKNARLVDWNVDQLHSLIQRVVSQRRAGQPNANVKLSPTIRTQLHDYVSKIESLYRDIPFHNFEHASHVSMSVNKLMKRIVDQEGPHAKVRQTTFGLSEDPLAHFAVVFSALIADVDHRGVPNEQLVKERDGLAIRYKNKSVAEQNSIKLAWETLKEDGYEDLREAIYEEEAERYRFRQLVANAVMATDIKEPKLQAVRKKRWNSVFRASSNDTEAGEEELEDRKAKLVIEHIMQAGNVAHTMQHWSIFLKWNECLYLEMYQAFKNGRADEDPSVYWYEDELRFFDNHVLPVAKKLKECGVFGGDSADEYLTLAEQNRKEWEMKGKDICKARMEKANENERFIDGS